MSAGMRREASRAPPAVVPLGQARVLIVDDDERTANAVATVLEDLGQPLVRASSGEEALKHLLVGDFAVILLDVQMPGMDGYEVASLVRARRRTRNIPIIFLTAVNRDDTHLFRAYSAGAVDMVFKPVDPFMLKSKVAIFVDLYLKQLEIKREGELRLQLQAEHLRALDEKASAEAALRRSRQLQQTVLRALPICFHSRAAEPPFVPLFLSETVERMTGFTPEALMAEPLFAVGRIHPEDRDRVGKVVGAAAYPGGSYACEFRFRCADGSYRVFHDQGIYTPGEDGGAPEIVGTLLDITEQRSLQQQLAQAQKMEAVGQLTGGIAHDFNNLLTVIFGNIDLLLPSLSENKRMTRKLLAMRYAAERARGLTGQLLAFSRRQHLRPEPIDIGERIREFATLLAQAVGETVRVSVDIQDAPIVAELDPAQFETTLLNLAVNARDAMPQGGAFSLSLCRVEDARELDSQGEARAGPWVLLKVADTGVGMAPDVLEHAFEPFFSTKDTGKGSGLGLSQVYGFVRQSDGFVTVTSKQGEGTEFHIYLPPSEKTVTARHADPAAIEVGERSGTVLVVEDDSAVLTTTSAMLSELGYRVLTAADANGALEILKREDRVDLLFTDVVMPGGRNGVQLADAAHALRPDLKVLLTSGYVGEALSRHRALNQELPLLAKPFLRDELDACIRSAFEARR